MYRHEALLLATVCVAFATLFIAISYFIHAENMACIKAGGTMIDRACHHSAEGASHAG